MSPFFRRGTTLACFHILGNWDWYRDRFIMWVIAGSMSVTMLLIIQVSMKFVRVDLEFFKALIILRTASGLTGLNPMVHLLSFRVSLSLERGSVCTCGIFWRSSVTLFMKKWFIVAASPAGELTNFPSLNSLVGGPELLQFSQPLTFFHKVLGSC